MAKKREISQVFSDSESQEEAVIRNFRITAADGKFYRVKHCSLQAIRGERL